MHPGLGAGQVTWGASADGGLTRYRFRGAEVCIPFDDGEIDPAGAHFRRTNHDDVGFVGQFSEQLSLALT